MLVLALVVNLGLVLGKTLVARFRDDMYGIVSSKGLVGGDTKGSKGQGREGDRGVAEVAVGLTQDLDRDVGDGVVDFGDGKARHASSLNTDQNGACQPSERQHGLAGDLGTGAVENGSCHNHVDC